VVDSNVSDSDCVIYSCKYQN